MKVGGAFAENIIASVRGDRAGRDYLLFAALLQYPSDLDLAGVAQLFAMRRCSLYVLPTRWALLPRFYMDLELLKRQRRTLSTGRSRI